MAATNLSDWRARLAPPLAGLAAFLLFVAPVLAPSMPLYYRDTRRLYYPVKRFIAHALQHAPTARWAPVTLVGRGCAGAGRIRRRPAVDVVRRTDRRMLGAPGRSGRGSMARGASRRRPILRLGRPGARAGGADGPARSRPAAADQPLRRAHREGAEHVRQPSDAPSRPPLAARVRGRARTRRRRLDRPQARFPGSFPRRSLRRADRR